MAADPVIGGLGRRVMLTRDRWIPLACIAVVAGGCAILLLLSRAGSSRANHAAVSVADSSLGRILVDRDQRPLYLYTRDKPGRSACDATCQQVWPPATVSGRPTLASGVVAAKLKTVSLPDHAAQLVYNGHQLYTFSGDAKPGQMDGENFLGVWYLVSPAGDRVSRPGAPTKPVGY